MKRFLSRLSLLLLLTLTAYNQEIQSDAAIPAVTSALMTGVPKPALQTAPAPATPTPVFSPAQALISGPIKIIAMGDDFTYGDGDKTGLGYTGRLVELVNQIRPGTTIKNLGRSGWASDDLLNGSEDSSGQLILAMDEIEVAFSQRHAVVVLVWVGGNDLWELYTGVKDVTVQQEEQDALRFSENIDTVLSTLRTAGAEVIIAQLDDQSKRPARTRSEAYPDITVDELLRMSEQIHRYNEILSEKATKYNTQTVDFYNTEIFTQSATLSADGFHPNAAGYELIAQAWYKSLIKILP